MDPSSYSGLAMAFPKPCVLTGPVHRMQIHLEQLFLLSHLPSWSVLTNLIFKLTSEKHL